MNSETQKLWSLLTRDEKDLIAHWHIGEQLSSRGMRRSYDGRGKRVFVSALLTGSPLTVLAKMR